MEGLTEAEIRPPAAAVRRKIARLARVDGPEDCVTRSAAVISAFVLGGAVVLAQPAPQGPAPVTAFRANIDLVSLNVTVTDSSRQFVGDLQQADFSVLEDGVKQDISFFGRQPRPISLSLLLDSSASMTQHLPVLQSAVNGFIGRLGPTDLAQVVDFDSHVQVRQSFTGDIAKLQAAVLSTTAGGSTALHNAIYVALTEFGKQKVGEDSEPRRQAVVVFSDGEDTSSLVEFDQVLDLAKRSDTAIYTIALKSSSPNERAVKEAEFALRQLAQETGGRVYFPVRIEELPTIYSQIADELGQQYSIGYTSSNAKRDGSWRRVMVRLARPNVTARTRTGYFAPSRR